MTFPFVSPAWLQQHLNDPNLVVVDGSWYLPGQQRDPQAEYLDGHIPGAIRIDIDAIKDESSHLPHMLPTAEAFAEYVGARGISEVSTIVIYDGLGLFSAPRVRWMFRMFGAITVYILEGGLPAWKDAGYAMEKGEEQPLTPRKFVPRFQKNRVVDAEAVQNALALKASQVVDARGAARFRGEEAEARPGLRSGHIPGSHNLPANTLTVDDAFGRLKPAAELRALINKAAINFDLPVITTCGSGVTAAIISLAFEVLQREPRALYDGAWVDWGSRQDLPVATGR